MKNTLILTTALQGSAALHFATLRAPNEQICKLCQSSGLYLGRNEGKSHGFGLFAYVSFVALLLLLVGQGEDALVVGLAGSNEVEKDASQLVGSGGDRLGSSQAGARRR